jgi:hypothetical protein
VRLTLSRAHARPQCPAAASSPVLAGESGFAERVLPFSPSFDDRHDICSVHEVLKNG